MSAPPTGTVTFLFTDIEGSTKLAEQHPAAWGAAQARHHAILRQSITAHDGHVFQIIGDAFCAAFATADEGLLAALSAQRALNAEPWGDAPIRVRIGLHTGAAAERDGEYHGYLTLSRTQRLMSAGHGGQTLISHSTAVLLAGALPPGVSLRDTGEHRLKDLTQPERIFQLVAPDLPERFPPLKTLDAQPNNLPVQLTSFIGREREIAEVKRLLGTARLVTLTASGGVGKTRLSLQVGAELIDTFPDGVWFVELAPLADPGLVPAAIATALGVRADQSGSLLAALNTFLHDKQLLLILDNCEHLIDACAQVADTLLRSNPRLRMLASSREALGIGGEVSFRVPSLALPDPQHLPALEGLSQFEAVRLFIDRAVSVQPHFSVTNQNAPHVAQICQRLDGIPLAIELAAARARALSVEQIAARLDDRFRLLTGGSRTALPRQQTLRALINWSYDLLSAEERRLLARLSVFAGGWTLEAAEVVCSSEPTDDGRPRPGGPLRAVGGGAVRRMTDISANEVDQLRSSVFRLPSSDILDLLTRLVDKSLVALDEQGGSDSTRYRLLETIRQYAHEKLLEAAETDTVRARHAQCFLQLAEAADAPLHSPEQRVWHQRLAAEEDNLRAALAWSQEADLPTALRLAGTLGYFWRLHSRIAEGRDWLERVLARTPEDDPQYALDRATALNFAALFSVTQMDIAAATRLDTQSIAAWRVLGEPRGLGYALSNRAQRLHYTGDPALARADIDEGVACFRQTTDRSGLAQALFWQTRILAAAGDNAAALASAAESLRSARQSGDASATAFVLSLLADLAFTRGEYDQARPYLNECLALARQVGDKLIAAVALNYLGELARLDDDFVQAASLYAESLDLGQSANAPWLIMDALAASGYTALRLGQFARARAFFLQDLPLAQMHDRRLVLARCFAGLAGVLLAGGADEPSARRAARLCGAAETIGDPSAAFVFPPNRRQFDQIVAQAREALAEAYAAEHERGRSPSLGQAVAYALEMAT